MHPRRWSTRRLRSSPRARPRPRSHDSSVSTAGRSPTGRSGAPGPLLPLTVLPPVRDGPVSRVPEVGCFDVQAWWTHWPCLFPQHGPGRKHERPIVLEPWQRELVEQHPGRFVRGLFHSDGCRVQNWATRTVGGVTTRYEGYPRYFFSNRSEDLIGLCTWALDLLGVRWTRPTSDHVSVARRASVAELDRHVGPKPEGSPDGERVRRARRTRRRPAAPTTTAARRRRTPRRGRRRPWSAARCRGRGAPARRPRTAAAARRPR